MFVPVAFSLLSNNSHLELSFESPHDPSNCCVQARNLSILSNHLMPLPTGLNFVGLKSHELAKIQIKINHLSMFNLTVDISLSKELKRMKEIKKLRRSSLFV